MVIKRMAETTLAGQHFILQLYRVMLLHNVSKAYCEANVEPGSIFAMCWKITLEMFMHSVE